MASVPLELVDGYTKISSLPLELVQTILSFRSEPSSQLQASQVCHSCNVFTFNFHTLFHLSRCAPAGKM